MLWQAQYFRSIHIKIAKACWNSEVKCVVDLSFLKEVLQKRFVFELRLRRKALFLSSKASFFESSLAEKLRLRAIESQTIETQKKNDFEINSLSNQSNLKSIELQTS